jgi:hypothetical protein
VQSPLSCVAGASGVDLKSRVEKIMTAPLASPLSRSKKALLLAAASFAFATPVAAGLLTPEGRQAVAPLARAVAAMSEPSRALGLDQAAPDESAKPVVLARADAVLAPSVVVAATDARAIPLARNLPPPPIDPVPQATPAQAAHPTEFAVLTPPPVARAIERAAPAEASADFVRTYAVTAGRREAIARWIHPICVSVVGLPDEQAAAAKARIEAVAKSVGVKIQSRQPAACSDAGVEVVFTNDAQGILDEAFRTRSSLMGDASSGTQSVRAMSLPIQAWYLTNGTDVAANDTGGLKALADYRSSGSSGLKVPVLYQWYPGPGQPTQSSNLGVGSYGPACCNYAAPMAAPPFGPTVTDRSRQFLNVFMIVDAQRIPHAQLGPIADYVAMLALSQSKSLGECQALPSITDLFASCPGHAAPEGLTAADIAYLRALYGADHTIWAKGRSAVAEDVAKAMASRLAGEARLAAR